MVRLLLGIISLGLMGCVGGRPLEHHMSTSHIRGQNQNNPLVVLVDDDLALYDQVITGIHVATRGDYRVLRMQEEGFVQSVFLADLIAVKPRALIALGPRSASAISSARVILPSAFSMVPRVENYELDNVFDGGIRMVPETKARIGLIRALMPNLRALGVMFSRQYSRNAIQAIRSLCDDEQFELVNIEVQSVSDVLPALMRDHRNWGAVLMIDDPVMLDMDVLAPVTNFLRNKGIAFFALDCSMVQVGALAAFGTNFFSLGRDLVEMVNSVEGGHSYQATNLIDPKDKALCINAAVAKAINDGNNLLMRAVDYAGKKEVSLRVFDE